MLTFVSLLNVPCKLILGSETESAKDDKSPSKEDEDEDADSEGPEEWRKNNLAILDVSKYMESVSDKSLFEDGEKIQVLFDLAGNDNAKSRSKPSSKYFQAVVAAMKEHFKKIPVIETLWINRLPASRVDNLGYTPNSENTDIVFNWCKRLGLLKKPTQKKKVRKNLEKGDHHLHTYLMTLLESQGVIKSKTHCSLVNPKLPESILKYVSNEDVDKNKVRIYTLNFYIKFSFKLSKILTSNFVLKSVTNLQLFYRPNLLKKL